MAKSTLEVEERVDQGSNSARRLRRNGWIPGNVHGLDRPPFAVQLMPKAIRKVLAMKSGQNTILTLQMSTRDVRREVIIRELQRDPVTDEVTHVDFLRIDPDKPVEVSVPVELTGTPVGVKLEGGLVDVVVRELTVSSLPRHIPDALVGDISELHINQHLEAKDLALPEGVELLGDPSTTLVTVAKPGGGASADDEAAEGEEAEGGEAGGEASTDA